MVLVGAFAAPALANPNQHLEMFVDDVNIASLSNISRQLQQPQRTAAPVITGMGRWDSSPSYGSVIYDKAEKIYKTWYNANGAGNPVCYATSVDGRNWTYPNLGLETSSYKTEIYTETNIQFYGIRYDTGSSQFRLYSPSVIKDDRDPDPSRRYKMIYSDMSVDGNGNGIPGELYRTRTQDAYGDAGVFTATSPDGIHWTRPSAPIHSNLYFKKQDESVSDDVQLFWDSQRNKYVIQSKSWDWRDRAGYPLAPTADHRIITRTESSDFVNWSTPQVIIRHTNTLPGDFAGAVNDPSSYGSSIFEYQGMYFQAIRIYQDTGVADGHRGNPLQIIDGQLAASRDGINWTRVANYSTFMPVGTFGTWDDGMVMPFNPIVGKNGDLEFYYQGWDGPHDYVEGVSPDKRVSEIGVGTLAAGRMVAMSRSGAGEGVVVADPFTGAGGELFVNASVASLANLRVGIVNSVNGQRVVYANFKDINSILTPYNALYYKVTWNSRKDLEELRNYPMMLEFYLNGDTRLYGYTTNYDVIGDPSFALPGDANVDGKVNTIDFNVLTGNFGVMSDATWRMGDFNLDDKVDSIDFAQLVANFGRTQPSGAAMGSVVPEPASLVSLSAIGLMSFLARSRRYLPARSA
jgi:hypothetical protein